MKSTTHDPESQHEEATTQKNAKSTLLLPGKSVAITETAARLAGFFGQWRKVFLLDGVPVLIKHCNTTSDIKLQPLKPVVAVTELFSIQQHPNHEKGDSR